MNYTRWGKARVHAMRVAKILVENPVSLGFRTRGHSPEQLQSLEDERKIPGHRELEKGCINTLPKLWRPPNHGCAGESKHTD